MSTYTTTFDKQTGKGKTEQQLGLWNALFTMAAITIILVWAVTALTNGDALWFIHNFNEQAETFIIHWDGEQYVVQRGDPGYDAIMDAFAEGIAHPKGFEGKVAFSEEGIRQYRERFRLLEVRFARPVQVHTRHPYNKAKTYLIPLDKTHAHWRRAFAYTGIVNYTSGPLNLSERNFARLVEAVADAVAQQP